MAGFLDELQSVPGVFGACLYHSQEGVLQANLPAVYTSEKMSEIGKILTRIHTAGQMNFSDLTDLSIRYDESTLLVRRLDEGVILYSILDPDCNQNLVTMSLNIIQQELKGRDLVSELPPSASHETGASAPQAALGPAAADVAPILTEMKNLLPKVLGPMAMYIFDESVDTWKEQGGGAKDSIPALIQLLNQEIGDEEKVKVYRGLIDPIL